MNTLYHSITGLCEFGPKRDIENPAFEKTNQMRVLFTDSHQLPQLPQGTPFVHEFHMPVLICQKGYVDKAGRAGDKTFKDSGGTTWSVFYLDDQDISIAAARPDSLSVPSYSGGGNGCPAINNYRSFNWVAPIAQMSPGSEVVKPSCLVDPAAGAVDPTVIARLSLTDGTIETYMIAKDYTDAVVDWQFKEPGGAATYNQVIADTVQFWSLFGSSTIDINTTLIRAATNPSVANVFTRGVGSSLPIRLRSAGNQVIADIKCMPWPDIAGTRPKSTNQQRDPDFDFAYFYNLSQNPGRRTVPYQVGTCPASTGPHLGNPNCPPTRAAADLAA
jgi:hypothetical protein